jgi:hypothetical protein
VDILGEAYEGCRGKAIREDAKFGYFTMTKKKAYPVRISL